MQSPWLMFCRCFELIVMACTITLARTNQSSTFGHRRNQAERIHREPSGLAMVDVWWPVLGRMHVADGERQDSRSGT